MSTDELLTYLFEGQPHPLSPQVATWLVSSRRFTDFVTAFRAKIRKKLRATQDGESLRDLGFELETACLLLRERPLSVVYEPPCGGGRCPDFAVTSTRFTFMLEVTRQHSVSDATPTLIQEQKLEQIPATSLARPWVDERLSRTICGKLAQLSKQHSNVLVVGLDAPCSAQDLRALMLSIQHRAERNDPSLVQRHRFRDRADFFRHYGRLSEVVVRGPRLYDERVVSWVNPQAKRPLPTKVRTALLRSHTA